MKLLKYENNKLKQQFIFTLPAGMSTCNRICPGCYAMKSQVRFPAALDYRNRMLTASQQPDFADRIIAELSTTRRSARTVRLHESGEFYSQKYINFWLTIVTALPQFTFYAFTKRLADFNFSKLAALPNFVLINSLQHGGLNYAPLANLRSNVFTCPATTGHAVTCGITCKYCQTKKAQYNGIQFVIH